MKRLRNIRTLVLVILVLTGPYISAFALTGASAATFPVPEPVSMILLGMGLISLAGFGRKWKRRL
jgi:hypothetical protein